MKPMIARSIPILATVFALLCVLTLVVACMSGASTSATPRSVDSLPTPSKPKTVLDLLRNIKLVAQSGSLLRRDFYGEATLLQYFGGVYVKLRRSDSELNGDILGFDDVSPTLFYGLSPLPGMSIRFAWYERTRTDNGSALSIRFDKSNTGFDDVVSVFGTSWKKAPLEPPIAHRVYDIPTRPHGNEVIIYEFRTVGVAQEMRVEFRGDATLYSIYIKGQKEG